MIAVTGAHKSPFFMWNVFTIVGSALRNGWRPAVRVCVVQTLLYMLICLPHLHGRDFRLAPFVDDDRHRTRRHRFHGGDAEMFGELRMRIGVVVETGCMPEDPGARKETPQRAALEIRPNVSRAVAGELANAFEVNAVLIPIVQSAHALVHPAASGVLQFTKRSHHLQLLFCVRRCRKAPDAEDEVLLRTTHKVNVDRRIDDTRIDAPPAFGPLPCEL